MKKKKMIWQQYVGMVCFVLLGAVCGVFMVMYIDKYFAADRTPSEELFSLAGLLFCMYFAIFVQIIIHEAGHLIFALLSGYQFSSFRIFSFMWVKENDKIRLKRLSIASTGGQCLMLPPDRKDSRIPVLLYMLGGSLMNTIAALVFLGLYFVCASLPFFAVIMLLFSVVGLFFAMMNGIPLRGAVDNDGYNAFSLTRNPEAVRSLWIQMKANEQLSKGVRLKDMPEEWFAVPSDSAMENSMVVVMGVLACNRLMDMKRFEEADRLTTHMLEIDSGIAGLHRNLLICDRVFIELITKNRKDILDKIFDKEQKKFMKQMKNFPSVLRTEYAYALLCEKDTEKANKVKMQFEKCAKRYPYQTDVQSERELMGVAEGKGI